MLSLRGQIENQIGRVTQPEFDFAITNLNLEIEYKFKRVPTIEEMKQVLLANIEFYRNRINMMMEVK